MRHRLLRRSALLGACLLAAATVPAVAQSPETEVEALIRLARTLNPAIAAQALEADAAAARAEAADALDDPKFSVEIETMRAQPSYRPTLEQALYTYRVSQMLPFWGKRDLRREIAEAESRAARAAKGTAENEVAFRIKEAYAMYHLAHLAEEETARLLIDVRNLSSLAQARYAQGLGKQQDVSSAEAERAALQSDLARMKADRRAARARINGLLARSVSTPLAEMPEARLVPPMEALPVDALIGRAADANPALRAQAARIEAADKSRDLADREWYPDFELGIGLMQREADIEGYEAMIGFNIPLQATRRIAMQREASAMAGAARATLDKERLDIATEIAAAHATLGALKQQKLYLRETTLPQARVALEASLRAYELAREEFSMVLLAEQTLKRAIIDWLNVQFAEQVRLADLERLVGGEL